MVGNLIHRAPAPQSWAAWRGKPVNRSTSTRSAIDPGVSSIAGTAARWRVATRHAVSLPRTIPAGPHGDHTRPQPSRCGTQRCAPAVVRAGAARRVGDHE